MATVVRPHTTEPGLGNKEMWMLTIPDMEARVFLTVFKRLTEKARQIRHEAQGLWEIGSIS
jgi:hypothetical protein